MFIASKVSSGMSIEFFFMFNSVKVTWTNSSKIDPEKLGSLKLVLYPKYLSKKFYVHPKE